MKTLLLIVAMLLVGCGKASQPIDVSATCLSASVYFIGNTYFFSNKLGIFIPSGWSSNTPSNSCGQVMNATLTSNVGTVIVTKGVPKEIQ